MKIQLEMDWLEKESYSFRLQYQSNDRTLSSGLFTGCHKLEMASLSHHPQWPSVIQGGAYHPSTVKMMHTHTVSRLDRMVIVIIGFVISVWIFSLEKQQCLPTKPKNNALARLLHFKKKPKKSLIQLIARFHICEIYKPDLSANILQIKLSNLMFPSILLHGRH